ncbi:cold shock domain-containing protein [Acinetobacter sp. GXMZU3951]
MFLEGKIKHYNSERGFGFIVVDESSDDIFFHIKDFPSWHIKPNTGETLKFRIVEEQGKFKAADIVRLELKPDDSDLLAQVSSTEKTVVLPKQSTKAKTTRWKFLTLFSLLIIAVLGFYSYEKVQDYRAAKQLKAEQLMQEQKKIVQQQREALGRLPEQILSAQGRQNLSTVGHAVNSQAVEPVLEIKAHAAYAASPQNTESVSQYKCDSRTHCSQMRSYDEAVFFLKNCPSTEMDGDGDGIPCERQFKR